MNHWIFQATPRTYDLRSAINRLTADRWTVPKQYRKRVQKGDKVFFWKAAGREGDAGIYALGEVTSMPGFYPELPEASPFVVKRDYLDSNPDRVDIEYQKKFDQSPILKKELLTHPVLKNLLVIKVRIGQVFPVRDDEIKPLSDLVSKRV